MVVRCFTQREIKETDDGLPPLSSSGGCKGPVKTLVVSYLTSSSRGTFPVVLSSFLATTAIVPPFLGGQQVSWESRRRGKWQVVVAQPGVVGASRESGEGSR
jgi:hypothetical protein